MNAAQGGATPDVIAPRDGEALDLDALRRWLSAAAPAWVSPTAAITVHQYPAGFSNLTYRLTVENGSAPRVLVLRRPPRGAPGGVAHDMHREHAILATLHPLGVPVPRPVACCDDAAVLGAPFYVMEHLAGPILRGAPPAVLTADSTTLPARMAALSEAVVQALVQVHAVPVAGTPLAAFSRGDGYVRRQVEGWTRRWLASRTRPVPALDAVAAWLDAHQPADSASTLVHNDFKLDNLVLDDGCRAVRAILDWEMATVGDPLMDLGTTLAYWVQADDAPVFRQLGLGVTALPGAYTRDEVVAAYERLSGRAVHDRRFHEAFGVFKVAVIAQQIVARFERGLTQDARFGMLRAVVEALGERALGVVQ